MSARLPLTDQAHDLGLHLWRRLVRPTRGHGSDHRLSGDAATREVAAQSQTVQALHLVVHFHIAPRVSAMSRAR